MLFRSVIILIVFTVNGSLSVAIAKPITNFIGISSESTNPFLFWTVRILLMFVIYQALLVIIGTLFGQHKFFWNMEKKMLSRMGLGRFFNKLDSMKKTTLIFILFIGLSQFSFAQENHETEKEPGLELVVSGIVITETKHNRSDLATEIHLTYWTTHKWAFGVGYTLIFEEHNKIGHEIAALVSHKPWSFLTVNSGPSFSLPNSEKDMEISWYVESEFAFPIGDFHVGPTLGILVGDYFRWFAGIHISYEF